MAQKCLPMYVLSHCLVPRSKLVQRDKMINLGLKVYKTDVEEGFEGELKDPACIIYIVV